MKSICKFLCLTIFLTGCICTDMSANGPIFRQGDIVCDLDGHRYIVNGYVKTSPFVKDSYFVEDVPMPFAIDKFFNENTRMDYTIKASELFSCPTTTMPWISGCTRYRCN